MKYNVMSLMKTDVKYHTNGKCIVIKAETTTELDSDVVKPEKIKDCYGNRVRIIENWDNFDTDLEVVGEVKPEEADKAEATEEITEEAIKEADKAEATEEPVKEEATEEPVKEEATEEVKEPIKKTQPKKPQGNKGKTNKR